MELYKPPDLVMDDKRRWLKWLGHVIGMNHTRGEAKYLLKISRKIEDKMEDPD
jgi:hypothetical protein